MSKELNEMNDIMFRLCRKLGKIYEMFLNRIIYQLEEDQPIDANELQLEED